MDRRPFLLCLALSLGTHLALFTLFRAGEEGMTERGSIPVSVYLRSEGKSAPSLASVPLSTPPAPPSEPLSREKTDPPVFRRSSGRVPAKSPGTSSAGASSPAGGIPHPPSSAAPSGTGILEAGGAAASAPLSGGEGPGNSSTSPTGSSSPPPDDGLVRAEPDYAENPPPTYPRPALDKGWEGTVWLQVRVTAAGGVAELKVERTSGHPVLDRAALNAVRSWRFRPARIGERAVEGVVLVPVEFTIRRS